MPNSDPFFYPDADTPFLEATFGCILIGEGLYVENNCLERDYGPIPIPLSTLTARGDLVTAQSNFPSPRVVALPLGEDGSFLSSTFLTPEGLEWVPFPCQYNRISGDDFTGKGQLLVGNGNPFPYNTACALPCGQSDYELFSDSTTALGVAWKSNPYAFSGYHQLIASNIGCNPDFINPPQSPPATGNILCYNENCQLGWCYAFGRACFAPQLPQTGSLKVGCCVDCAVDFITFPSDDTCFLSVDSTCQLALKYRKELYYPQTTPVCNVTIRDQGTLAWSCEVMPGSCFPEGCKVFVSLTLDKIQPGLCLDGKMYMSQGSNASFGMCYYGDGTEPSCRMITLSYIVPSWCAICPVNLHFTRLSSGSSPTDVCFHVQPSAFALDTGA